MEKPHSGWFSPLLLVVIGVQLKLRENWTQESQYSTTNPNFNRENESQQVMVF